jgi:hypothetical protein
MVVGGWAMVKQTSLERTGPWPIGCRESSHTHGVCPKGGPLEGVLSRMFMNLSPMSTETSTHTNDYLFIGMWEDLLLV